MEKRQIENALRDYSWMINEIKRQRGLLGDAGTKLVAQSGIESTMPKPQGETGDPVAQEVVRRDKKHTWIRKLEKKVLFIQERISVIENEREKAVLECMLDGMSMIAISKHMGLSRRHIYNIKETIVYRIAHFAQFSRKMTNEKQCS
ncbi:DNA-binding response regulator [Alteribacillus sp. JSM 102045]|uniref:DNA-binding response regulator n=1 Tax=Alteribacillus sp. JSM 102045 TaxID=1562101 RepID=UPI0035C04F8C